MSLRQHLPKNTWENCSTRFDLPYFLFAFLAQSTGVNKMQWCTSNICNENTTLHYLDCDQLVIGSHPAILPKPDGSIQLASWWAVLHWYRVVRQWWIIRKPPETCWKPTGNLCGRFPAGFWILKNIHIDKKLGNLPETKVIHTKYSKQFK